MAAERRLSKSGVLHHFSGRHDIAAAMIERSIAWFDAAVDEAATAKPRSLGRSPGEGFDAPCASITTALLAFPERLGPVREKVDKTDTVVLTGTPTSTPRRASRTHRRTL